MGGVLKWSSPKGKQGSCSLWDLPSAKESSVLIDTFQVQPAAQHHLLLEGLRPFVEECACLCEHAAGCEVRATGRGGRGGCGMMFHTQELARRTGSGVFS